MLGATGLKYSRPDMTANTRLKVGLAFAIGGNLLFFTSAWIAWMPWSASFKATLWGILFFAPETGTLICIAIIGKENYERFKNAMLETWRQFRAGQAEGKLKEPEKNPEAPSLAIHSEPTSSTEDERQGPAQSP